MYCGMTLVVARKMQNNIYAVKRVSAFCIQKLMVFLYWHSEIF